MRGIALEGGGAKGSFQVGVIKALKDLNIEYDVIVGSSIGAINGAILATGKLELLEKIWLSTEMEDMINGDSKLIKKIMNLDFNSDQQKMGNFILETIKQGGLDVSPYQIKLRAVLDEEAVRKSHIDYGLVTLSLTDFKPIELFIKDIPEGKLYDYILASANFPAFKSEKFENKKMLDGGFFDNLPINMLIDRGCDEVIAIRLMAFGRIRKVKEPEKSNITYIVPSENLGRALEIDPIRAKYNIDMGYYDTMKVFSKLHGNLYYIRGGVNETEVVDALINISQKAIEEIGDLLNMDRRGSRLLFEEILPLVASLLKLDKSSSYGTIVLQYYEFLAEQVHINRFQIMTFKELIECVNKYYIENRIKNEVDLNEISQKVISTLPTRSALLFPQKTQNDILIKIFYSVLNNIDSE